MMTLPLEFIAKVMPLLASDKDGEVVNAARKITKKLAEAKHDWHDVVKALTDRQGVFDVDPWPPTRPAQSPFPWGMDIGAEIRRAEETMRREAMRHAAAEAAQREARREAWEAGKVLRAQILDLAPKMMETGFALYAAEAQFLQTLLDLAHQYVSVQLSAKQAKWWVDIVNRWAAKEESHG